MRTNLTQFVAASMRLTLCILAAITLFPVIGRAQEYTVTDLGNLGGAISISTGVNNKGQVSGYSPTQIPNESNDGFVFTYPFIYSNGVMNALFIEDEAQDNYAFAINNNGTVVGDYMSWDEDGGVNAFQWNGAFQELASQESCAVAINEDGVSVGVNGILQTPGYNPNCNSLIPGEVPVGVIFQNGSIIDIPTGPYLGVNPVGINNAEQIAGLCISETMAYLGCVVSGVQQQLLQPGHALKGNVQASPAAINALGNTCGETYTGSYFQPSATVATYWEGLVPVDLGTPSDSKNSQCLGMDDYGNGVGSAISKSGSPIGVLFDPVDGARNLNSLIPQLYRKGQRFQIINAASISDTGFIAAQCLYEDGKNDACLLTPQPTVKLVDSLVALAKSEPRCVSCEHDLVPEARTLPKSLADLSRQERQRVIDTAKLMSQQIESLESDGQISELKASLLAHQTALVLAAVDPGE